MRLLVLIFIMAFALEAPAAGAREPITAPAGEWVENVPIPEPNPALRDRPYQALLTSSQSLYGQDRHDHYSEIAFLIQNSQGLQALGNIVLPWQPEQSDLIVHKVRILRAGQVIDLLADHEFTVLRRENNLESAMLDGVLTAIMQAEGLAVGDVLQVAFTVRRRAGALPLRGENLFRLAHGAPIRRFNVRQIWPRQAPMRWRATGIMEQARIRNNRLGTELLLDLRDAEGPEPPKMAPARFAFPASLQLSEFRDWAEISAQLAPHYDRAQELAPSSALRAEIDRIAAQSEDPRVRAMAALRLVQDEVRYFAVFMGDGNYLPATAEQTWTRRYGDCKGKSALLVALLRGLGIAAEPMLVHSTSGDGLNEQLPQLILFDHVLVRATIDGRSYWLDGTRTGDRLIDDLASSTLGWGLAVRGEGADLERLPFMPPALPLTEERITYDASQGLLGVVPVTAETVLRGELATMLRLALAQGGEESFRRMATELAAETVDEEGRQVSYESDDALGTFTLRFSGNRTMDWTGSATSRRILFRFDSDTISWEPDFTRPEGSDHGVPFRVSVPAHIRFSETVILPDGGSGFTLEGEDIDRSVAGVRITRTVSLENGRATALSTFRQLALEISASEAAASVEPLREIRASRAMVRGSTRQMQADLEAARAREPGSAREFVTRGYAFLQTGELSRAEADFERAASLEPEWSRPLSNHALVMVRRGNFEEAEALLARATDLDPDDFVIPQVRGIIHLARGEPREAATAFTRSLELDRANNYTLAQRAAAYQQLGEFDSAMADLEAIIASEPAHAGALLAKARLHAFRGEHDEAVAAADAAVAASPAIPSSFYSRARILSRIGRREAAAADYRQALALLSAQPAESEQATRAFAAFRHTILAESGETAQALREMGAALAQNGRDPLLLNERCWARATANLELEEALADCERALAITPENASIIDSRAFVKLRLGRLDEAIADASAALALEPRLAASLYVRGIARLRKGEREAGEADLRAARRITYDIEAEYRLYGVTP